MLDDLGDRLHIVYLGMDERRAGQLGYWQVDRGVFEVVVPRQEVTDLAEERHEFPIALLLSSLPRALNAGEGARPAGGPAGGVPAAGVPAGGVPAPGVPGGAPGRGCLRGAASSRSSLGRSRSSPGRSSLPGAQPVGAQLAGGQQQRSGAQALPAAPPQTAWRPSAGAGRPGARAWGNAANARRAASVAR